MAQSTKSRVCVLREPGAENASLVRRDAASLGKNSSWSKGKGKGKFHLRTGHEVPDGE